MASDLPKISDGHPQEVCPLFHAAVELIGRRWTGAILATLARGHELRFSEIEASIPDISPRLLTERLRELAAEGVVERRTAGERPARVSYALTPKGAALMPVLDAIGAWAAAWRA